MGIPCYFSYIIKNYPNILLNLSSFSKNEKSRIDHLFMDCNSIIYDAVNNKLIDSNSEKENAIISYVIASIQKYITMIRPSRSVFIAFDGVAPFAKMEQQRTRRYKTAYMSILNQQITKLDTDRQSKCVSGWNTAAITPGTQFMEKLSKRIMLEFTNNERRYNIQKFIVSCSDQAGEGEHKIMEYIRTTNNLNNDNIALYGLDADLIMLSIFHLKYVKNIFVFREAPDFLQFYFNSNKSKEENEDGDKNLVYFLDIDVLSASILTEMNCSNRDSQRINDYIFLCFLLGNDFLPHFPAMNIRTHGIQALLDIYRLCIGNSSSRFLISKSNNKIQWKNVGIFMDEIAKREHEFILNEYFVRDKFDKRKWNVSNSKEYEEMILNLPVIYRQEEKYICPSEMGWEKRYYKTLFHSYTVSNHQQFVKSISINYLEGLEWVYSYYTSGCRCWKWKYNYSYPPLFKDLCKYIPSFESEFIQASNAFSPQLQLSYVLPRSQLGLLPNNIHHFLITNHSDYYPSSYEFQWAFCRYFWESHPILPEIPLEVLEQWDRQFTK
jgi:5'-3' exonuclease